jgi:hypothetical protein
MTVYLLSNFENGAPGWRPVNHAAAVTMNVTPNGVGGNAQSGFFFLRASATILGGSVAVDHNFAGGVFPVFLAAYAWVRALNGPVSGLMTLWDLAGNRSFDTPFTANENWQLVGNGIDPTGVNVRLEFYINKINTNIDIDTAVLF